VVRQTSLPALNASPFAGDTAAQTSVVTQMAPRARIVRIQASL